ncbi:MAG: DUF6034 family protein [Christensenellales bacterium]
MKNKNLKVLSLLLCFSFLFSTTACQPTPDEPPVVGKNNTNALVQATEAPYEVPTHWTEPEAITLNDLTVEIDADIVMPDVTKFPVDSVKDKVFTQEEADKFVAILSEGKPLLSTKSTRAELEKVLVLNKAELNRLKKEDPDSQLILTTEAIIADTEERIKNLPEKEVIEPPNTTFHNTGYADAVQVRVDLGETKTMFIDIANCLTDHPMSSHLQLHNGSYYCAYNFDKHEVLPENSVPQGVAKTKDQAMALAQTMIVKLGIPDMRLEAIRPAYLVTGNGTSVNEDVQGWQFTYTRQVAGIPVSLYKDSMASNWGGAIAYGKYNSDYSYEAVTIQIDDTGITYLFWGGPMEIMDTLNDNAKLLSFSGIQEGSKRNCPKNMLIPRLRRFM